MLTKGGDCWRGQARFRFGHKHISAGYLWELAGADVTAA